MNIIQEGKAKFYAPAVSKISRALPVFYNPVMKFNRDISVLLLRSLGNKDLQIALPLAGTGVRGIRFSLELEAGLVRSISYNDNSKKAVELIKKNIRLNNVKKNMGKYLVSEADADLFLLSSSGFDYIDIDPFGSPNPFLDSAVKRLSRRGVLAVTATDTAPLCGTYPRACMRKYWAAPKRDSLMYETGLRILIRKIQLIGAQSEKALIPVFSYFRHHYFRVFFRCIKKKSHVDEVIKQHGLFNSSGPMWLGSLWDVELVEEMLRKNSFEEHLKFLNTIFSESKIPVVGYYDIHYLAKKKKTLKIPRKSLLIEKISMMGYNVSETHFSDTSIRSDIPEKELLRIINC